MQWTSEINAGFTGAVPWLPVNDEYMRINVQAQEKDEYSLLKHTVRLIRLRNNNKALNRGDWIPVTKGQRGILAYYRIFQNEKILVLLNFSSCEKKIHIREKCQWKVIHSTHRATGNHYLEPELSLQPFEATLIEKIGEL